MSKDCDDILLLSLAAPKSFDESYSCLLDDLSLLASLKRAKSAHGAIRYLEQHQPRAVIIANEEIVEGKHKAVLDIIKVYIHQGGLVLIGLHVPNFVEWPALGEFFEKEFGLPWKAGNFTISAADINRTSPLPPIVKGDLLPTSYSAKALHILHARPYEKILIPKYEYDHFEERVPMEPAVYLDQVQAIAVGTRVGEGYLMYLGDVNPGKEFDQMILSLCGV